MDCLTFCLCRKSINWENTKPFIPNIKSAKVIKVYDGDTITIAAKIHFLDCQYYRFSVRLAHIDSPELKTKNIDEKNYALRAKTELENVILNKMVNIKIFRTKNHFIIIVFIYYFRKIKMMNFS